MLQTLVNETNEHLTNTGGRPYYPPYSMLENVAAAVSKKFPVLTNFFTLGIIIIVLLI